MTDNIQERWDERDHGAMTACSRSNGTIVQHQTPADNPRTGNLTEVVPFFSGLVPSDR